MITIRRLTEEDLPRLDLLYRELSDKEARPERMPAVFDRMKADPHYIVLVAEEGDRLLGSVMGVLCMDLFARCIPFMVLENLIVSESARGLGIGARLTRELEREAAAFDCHYVMLVSGAAREGAHTFYERMGYDVPVRGFKKYLNKG